MEPLVDVVIEDDRWAAFGLEPVAVAAVSAALAEVGLPEAGITLCLMGCDDTRIAALNAGFRGKVKATNVLSWPSEERGAGAGSVPDLPEPGEADDPYALGDVALAYETCAAEALAAGKPFADHVTHLVVHGLLHLLGYDHIRAEDGDLMEAVEARILARLGLCDPYSV